MFTAHLRFTHRRSSEIQYSLDGSCNHLQHDLSRSLIGNSYKKKHIQYLQPMIICFFDQEGSMVGISSDTCEFPHVHGILILHPSTLDAFMKITKRNYDGRLELKKQTYDFREITFKTTNNDTNGIMGLIDYYLKNDKIKSRSGDNIYSYGIYPSNTSWGNHLAMIPESELRQHNFIKKSKMH